MATYTLTIGEDSSISTLKYRIFNSSGPTDLFYTLIVVKTSVDITGTNPTINIENPSGSPLPSAKVPTSAILGRFQVDSGVFAYDARNISSTQEIPDSWAGYPVGLYDCLTPEFNQTDTSDYTLTVEHYLYLVTDSDSGDHTKLFGYGGGLTFSTGSTWLNRIYCRGITPCIIIIDENDNYIGGRDLNTFSYLWTENTHSTLIGFPQYITVKNKEYPDTEAISAYSATQWSNSFTILTNSDTNKNLKTLYNTLTGIPGDNPFDDSSSGTGGGDGGGTPTDNDTQPDDGVPSLSITDTGLISLYTPSISELRAFGNYLWSDAFSLDTFKKLFSDPMDAILGMSVIPLNLSGETSSLVIGNVDTGLTAPKLSRQYYTIDCGSFTVQPDVNSYLDYSPYTRFSVFLPYIGFQTLDADDIMNQTLNIKYKVDVLTTALICEIRIDDHLRYSFSGTCGTSVPITAQNWGSMIQSVVSSATALAGLAVGAAAAPVTGGASLGMSAVGAAGSIAGNSLSMKPDIQKGGSLGGSPGFMGWQVPFLIRYTPRRINSKSQQAYTGYPSLITSKLSDVHGYTEIQSINLSVSGATDSECAEIDRQLKQGVILP